MLQLALIDLLGVPVLLAWQIVIVAQGMPREATFREKLEALKEPVSVVLGGASLIFLSFIGYAIKPGNGWLIIIIPITLVMFIGGLKAPLDEVKDFRQKRQSAAEKLAWEQAEADKPRQAALRAHREKLAWQEEQRRQAFKADVARSEIALLERFGDYRLAVDFTGKQPMAPIIEAFRRALLANPPDYLGRLRHSQHPTIRAIIGNGAGWPPA